jgi:hypothetical protein
MFAVAQKQSDVGGFVVVVVSAWVFFWVFFPQREKNHHGVSQFEHPGSDFSWPGRSSGERTHSKDIGLVFPQECSSGSRL